MTTNIQTAAATTLRPMTIAEMGALWARAVAVEKELLDMIPAEAVGTFEFPLLDAMIGPVGAITKILLAMDATTDAELLIQARAQKHIHGGMA